MIDHSTDGAMAVAAAVLTALFLLAFVAEKCIIFYGNVRNAVGYRRGVRQQQDEAIRAGVGFWHCDPKTGNIVFRYGPTPDFQSASVAARGGPKDRLEEYGTFDPDRAQAQGM